MTGTRNESLEGISPGERSVFAALLQGLPDAEQSHLRDVMQQHREYEREQDKSSTTAGQPVF